MENERWSVGHCIELLPYEIRNASWSVPEEGYVLSEPVTAATEPAPERSRLRRGLGIAFSVAAIVLIVAALLLPNTLTRLLRTGAFFRLPVEGFVAIGLLLLIPGARWKKIVAGVLGAGLGLLVVEKILDIGFYKTLARPFDPVLDWVLVDDAESFLKDSVGSAGAIGALIGVIALILLIVSLLTWAAIRVVKLGDQHRKAAAGTAITGTAIWVVLLMLGVQAFTGIPVAARSSYTYAWDRAHSVKKGLNDEKTFAREVKIDAFATTPPDQLLTSLRGKDVMVTFVESYGRSAVEDPALNPGTVKVLDEGSASLAKAGYVAKSGWLTSPTAGGGSWLAHSTLLSGLWINNQQRYRNLTSSDRLTLTSLFKKADWDTMSVMPGATRAWPEGNFYGYNRVYDSRNTGYAGPKFGWGPQPDQYTLDWFQKNVHAPAHSPMFVEMPLVSSHTPWAPLPTFIDWKDVGDGAVYTQLKQNAKSAKSVWSDPEKVKHEYARSVQYTLTTIISYLEKFGDDNTVMVFLGDHQPAPIVVGDGASHDVPITILAKDKKVLDKVADWNWSDGIKPAPNAPVWPMNQFRDRFLTAFGPTGDVSRALSPPR
ncbi:sulfatase-like hydrolase/transferase [Actinoplanes sp. TFC3]|uniref:sulfatase-like hydrolase/transferase n=1 Tax=Actinoplanes sp. TFC3 TaxID=1710355 RepID=UPI0012905F68|nr:sulfatase-like hydrolase/transferase [Actinoplanes sp. TFC3]